MTAEFTKVITSARGEAEVRGWLAVRHLNTPALLDWKRGTCTDRVVYEDVFAAGRCRQLLGDCINLADRGLAPIEPITELIRAMIRDFARSLHLTGSIAPMRLCVSALYADRLRQSGRIDNWYPPSSTLHIRSSGVKLTELREQQLEINESEYRLDWAAMLDDTRRRLAPGTRWLTALTQGDPTEPNVGNPLIWLDFEHAGRNTIVGEIANTLWYLLALGGWLVPRYQPEVYARTLKGAHPPVVVPHLTTLAVQRQPDRISLTFDWRVGIGRAEAIRALVNEVREVLTPMLACDERELFDLLRPFLVTRILGVLPLLELRPEDALLCLAKLAQLQRQGTVLDDFLLDIRTAETVTP